VLFRDSTVQDASGGVIVTEGAFATIEKCYIKNSFMIGLLHSIGRQAYVAETSCEV